MGRQRIAILGATGSIGEQTLEVVARHAELFEPITLTAHRDWQRLAEQAREWEPDSVVIADKRFYEPLKAAIADLPVKVWAGAEAVEQIVAESNVDVVVNAIVGYAGLAPTVSAARAGKKIALANKESLVVAGELVMRLAQENNAPLLPIDSEHSAILQCLVGESSPLERLIITASGGALRDFPLEALATATAEQALAHPNWTMGAKITIDSATLVNKGFEVIEAHWLFGVPTAKIDVLVHPQSIVHSMVEFADGAVKAQLGTPDMKIPIQYALTFPHRLSTGEERLSLERLSELTFAEVDAARYPALGVARGCLERGGTACCAMNAANEVAVAAFLQGRIGFTEIVRTIEKTVARAGFAAAPTLEDYIACNREARLISNELIN
jgi:1-deoxy-D-xylulose-5-phosphate reductoisomerase